MNTNFEIKDNIAIVRINKEIYPKEVLIQAAYVKMEQYYIIIDKDENYYIVELKLKNNQEISEQDIYGFFDEIIESQSYIDQLKRTSKLREIILEQALIGQTVKESDVKKANN